MPQFYYRILIVQKQTLIIINIIIFFLIPIYYQIKKLYEITTIWLKYILNVNNLLNISTFTFYQHKKTNFYEIYIKFMEYGHVVKEKNITKMSFRAN